MTTAYTFQSEPESLHTARTPDSKKDLFDNLIKVMTISEKNEQILTICAAQQGYRLCINACLLLFRCQVMPDSLWPRAVQHTRLPGPSPSPGAC